MLTGLVYSNSGRIASAYRANEKWRQDKARADRLAAWQLVLETVHPGNLGVLPPSPRVLTSKAYLLGLEWGWINDAAV